MSYSKTKGFTNLGHLKLSVINLRGVSTNKTIIKLFYLHWQYKRITASYFTHRLIEKLITSSYFTHRLVEKIEIPITLSITYDTILTSIFKSCCQGRILVEIVWEVEKNLGEVQRSSSRSHGKLGLRTGESQRRDVCM